MLELVQDYTSSLLNEKHPLKAINHRTRVYKKKAEGEPVVYLPPKEKIEHILTIEYADGISLVINGGDYEWTDTKCSHIRLEG